jgi:chromosome segregation ATPase|tara:strand:+ start:4522 stop:5424 length:903 start_codon:yes stop_codon:yes gene_type:complete
MSNRNDPERLEAEADELMNKMRAVTTEPEASDNQEVQLELVPEAPEPTDTAETVATDTDHIEGGDSDDDLRLEIQKANKAMKGAQSRMTKATQEAADLKRQNADLLATLTELKSEFDDRKKDDSKLSQLREDYPDLAAPLLDELERTQGQIANQQEALAQQAQSKVDEQNEKIAEAHFDRIQSEHPDVNDLVETADWLNWLEEQDAPTKQWIQTGSSNDVNTVLHRFKADMGVVVQTPQERALAKAKAVAEPKMPKARKPKTEGGKKVWTVDEIKRMPIAQFEEHQAEIMEAMGTNNIRQ